MIATDVQIVTGANVSVADVLDVDREFRRHATAGDPYTPVLHTARGACRYTARYSSTPRAHQLGRTRDWVVVSVDTPEGPQQYTVVTERRGLLARRRVVRGREVECARHYHLPRHRFVEADHGALGDIRRN